LSGIYINQLSGISLESVDKLANEDQVTYLAVWDDVQTRGLRRFTTNVIAYFKTKYRLKQLLDRLTFGLSMTTEDLPPANEYRGIRVTLNPDRDSPMVSPLISIAFDKIQFYSDGYVGNLTFVIGDPNIGVIFTTIVAVVDGWNTVIEHWQSPVIECPRSLSLAVNCSLLSTIKTVIPTTSSSGCGCDCACVCLSDCCSAKVEGITYRNTAVSITPDNAHGFKGYVSMKCSYDGLVCVNKDLFSTALWYLLGSEMMLERINSPRINKFTTVDLKKAKELQEYFEGMWKQELGIVIDSIDLNDGDCCLECDPVISYRETIL
jgi:hypothetical protein